MDSQNNNSIFLTGATGLIGSHIAEHFAEKGFQITCGMETSDAPDFLKALPVKLVDASITNPHSLTKAMKGASTVIHTAGKVNDWGDWESFYNLNILGTRNVLQSCLANGIKKIILTGSISCFGEETCSFAKNEQSPHKPKYPYFLEKIWPSGMNYYRVSKSIEAKEAREFSMSKKLNVTIIHPVWVYGEREFSSGFYEYMKFVKTGIPFGPGSSKNYVHSIYAHDLARAYELVLEKAPPGFNTYIIGNKEGCRQEEIFKLICSEMNVHKPGNLPKVIVWPIGIISEAIASILHRDTVPFLTRARVNMFYDSICYDTQKAQEEISFTNRFSLEEGIKNTVKWYREQQLI